jgi:hypothetical protein
MSAAELKKQRKKELEQKRKKAGKDNVRSSIV